MNWRIASNPWIMILAVVVSGGVVSIWLAPSSPENQARPLIDFPAESTNESKGTGTQSARGYLGPQACAECHLPIFQSFAKTGHAAASSVARPEELQKSLPSNPHRVVLTPDSINVDLEIRPEGAFQTAVATSGQSRFEHTERFDIVIGSGKMGHTFMFWKGPRLYQLPVGYVSITNEWCYSPGFPKERASFSRPIDARCLECHITFAQVAADDPYSFDRDSLIYGVSCESCHGPGQRHVEYHKSNPDSASAQFVINPAKTPRERQIDVCSLCHAGGGVKDLHTNAFSFCPGDPLEKHLRTKTADEITVMGPHSNDQFLRLSQSRCFTESDRLVCTTCHNPHSFERNNTAHFSKRCQTCHSAEACGKSSELGTLIRDNCVDCHMRKAGMELHEMGFFSEGTASGATLMRDHWIRVPKNANDGDHSLFAILAPQARERLKQLQIEFALDSAGEVQRLHWPAGLPTQELVLLRTFSKLQDLDLSGQSLDQAAWDIVLQLKQVRRLGLSKTRLSDRHIKQLTRLIRLRHLDVSACPQVTDESIADLESFVVLESVDLRETSVSSAGIERLRINRPGCNIRH